MTRKTGYGQKIGKRGWILFCLLCTIAPGCIFGPGNTLKKGSPEDGVIYCGDKRPEICTMEYVPVCADLKDGSSATYSNACSACSDVNVVRYQAGPCP